MVLTVEYHGQVRTLFGESRESITIKFSGQLIDTEIKGTLERTDLTAMHIACRLTKCAALPA